MRSACFHIKKAIVCFEAHNIRARGEVKNSYKELFKFNDHWITGDEKKGSSREARLQYIKDYCQKEGNKKFNKNARPIREGSLTLNPDHKREDIEAFCLKLKEEFRIDVFQWYIHHDEGTLIPGGLNDVPEEEMYRAEELEPGGAVVLLNSHAHIIMDWQDRDTLDADGKIIKAGKKGRMMRFDKDDLSRMQVIASEVLGMPAGLTGSHVVLDHDDVEVYKKKAQAEAAQKKTSFKKDCPSLTEKQMNTLIYMENTLKKSALQLAITKKQNKRNLTRLNQKLEQKVSTSERLCTPVITSLKTKLESLKNVAAEEQKLEQTLKSAQESLKAAQIQETTLRETSGQSLMNSLNNINKSNKASKRKKFKKLKEAYLKNRDDETSLAGAVMKFIKGLFDLTKPKDKDLGVG